MFGGNAGPIWRQPHNIFCGFGESSMTAISLIYVKSGFAIAADGKSTWDDPSTITEEIRQKERLDEQKIFRARFKSAEFGYAITGSVYNKDRTFNFIKDMQVFFENSHGRPFQSLENYIDEVALAAKRAYDNAWADGRSAEPYLDNPCGSDLNEKSVVAQMFLAGYFRERRPYIMVITLRHENHEKISQPSIRFDSPPQEHFFVGSKKILKRLGRPLSFDSSLAEASARAKSYIDAHCEPTAVDIDPFCAKVGGHVHVAEVTSHGFKWKIPPLASNPNASL